MRALIIGWAIAASLACYTAFGQEAVSPPPLKPEELQQLVAPIALYPDNLLSQVLIASTYPLEVVAADRWVKTNAKLDPETRKGELQKQSWDTSVKSLTATPSVLATMSEKLDWTQKLGDAMLAQQEDLMDAVQVLRSKAMAQKTLQSTPQQTVETQTVENKQVIIIQSATPQTVYVPYYDPTVVYGTWAYPAYPPPYYPPPGYIAGSALMSGLFFGAGMAIADGIWDNNDCDWGSGNINVNNNVNIDRGDRNNINNRPGNDRPGNARLGADGSGKKWKHDTSHRRGVKYNNAAVQQKFNPGGRTPNTPGAATRADFRGKDGPQGLQPSAGNRAAGRPNQPGGSRRDASSNQGRAQDFNRSRPTSSPDVSGIGRRNNNAFAGVGSGQTTRARADRGRSSFAGSSGGGGRPSGGGRSGGGGGRRR